jgi:hypothetical protein
MSSTASRCDQIVALIDACLAEVDSSSDSGSGQQRPHLAGGGRWSPTRPLTAR